jgi:hypothetical protein
MKISIVTPTLNAAHFLEKCAASVQRERDSTVSVEIEHIVVDGGSTDRTVEVASEFRCVTIQEMDDGIFDAANRGYRSATGDIVGFLGADDELVRGAAGMLADWFSVRESDWAVGALRWVGERNQWLGDIGAPPTWLTPAIYASLGWNCIHHLSTYLTPDFFSKLGGFDPGFRISGDCELLAPALALQGFDRIPDTISAYGPHGTNAGMSKELRAASEIGLVAARNGPSSPLARRGTRWLLKTWLNAPNPRWAAVQIQSRLTGNAVEASWA